MNKSEKIIASMKQEYKTKLRLKKLIMGDLFYKLNRKTSKLRTLSSSLVNLLILIFSTKMNELNIILTKKL